MFKLQSTLLAITLALAGAYAVGSGAAEKPRSQQVLECMRANLPTSVIAEHLKLTHVDALDSTSTYELQAYARRGEETFETSALVKAPASLAGGAYLLKATTENYLLYMYVPSLGQVRRVTGDGITQSKLLGTDLSWEDLQIMYSALMEGTLSYRGEGEYKGRKVNQLLLIPSPKSQSAYSRIYLDVDQQTCLPLEVRLTAEGDELLKKLTVDSSSLQQIEGKYWYASQLRLDDIKEGTHTRMEVTRQLAADEKLRSQLFSSKQFYRSR